SMDGQVKCWGQNSFGELGNDTNMGSSLPVLVSALQGVAHLSSGSSFNCAVLDTGRVTCWGFGSDGEMGDGSSQPRLVPSAPVNLVTAAARVTTGSRHACA